MLENRNRKKKKDKKGKIAKNPIKIGFFLRWSSKNVKNQKNWIFSQNCLTLFVSGREKESAFSLQLSVSAKFFLDQNSVKQEKL